MPAPPSGVLYNRTTGPTRTDLVGQGILKVPALSMQKYKAPGILEMFSGNKDAARSLMQVGIGMMANNDKGIWGSLAGGAQGYLDSVNQQRDQFNADQDMQNQNAQQTFQNQNTVLANGRADEQLGMQKESHAAEIELNPLRKKQLEQEISNGEWENLGNGWARNRRTKELTQPPKAMLQQILSLESAKAGINAAASAAASPTSYSTGNYMTPDGNIVSSRMSNRSGTPQVRDDKGNWVDAAPGGRFTTDGAGGVVTPQQFNKLEAEVVSQETGLKQLVQYGNNAGSLPQGIERWANTVTGAAKTLFGSQLGKDEFNQKIAQGELQGLIGAMRLEVLGPGVLTEQDAQRLINFLGGDPASALQNPEVLKSAMQRIIDYKMDNYTQAVGAFNRSAPSYGQPNKDVQDFSGLFKSAVKANPPAGVDAPQGGTGTNWNYINDVMKGSGVPKG